MGHKRYLAAEVCTVLLLFYIKFGNHNAMPCFPGKPRPRVVWYRDDRPLSTPSWTGTDPGSGLEVQYLFRIPIIPSAQQD